MFLCVLNGFSDLFAHLRPKKITYKQSYLRNDSLRLALVLVDVLVHTGRSTDETARG